MSAHGAAKALAAAIRGLEVDAGRMRRNIEALQGLVFSEGVSTLLASHLGKTQAHARIEAWSGQAVTKGRHLRDVALHALADDAALAGVVDRAVLEALFDVELAARRAGDFSQPQLDGLRGQAQALSTVFEPSAGAKR